MAAQAGGMSSDIAIRPPGVRDPLLKQAAQVDPELDAMEPWGRSPHSPADIIMAFAVTVLCGGNAKAACRTLEERQVEPLASLDEKTLRTWMHRWPGRYAHVGRVFSTVAEEQIITALRDNLTASIAASTAAVHLEQERIEDGKVKDAGAAAQRLMTVAGIAADKMSLLTGRPTQNVQIQTGEELLRTLAAFGQAAIDAGTVDSDAEIVDE